MRWFCLSMALALTANDSRAADPVDFNREVRPILANHCFRCHGPDKAQRKSELRLDTQQGAFEDRGGYQAVSPKNPMESALLSRILSDDEDERMPPRESGRRLNRKEIDTLQRWIAEGGRYARHWSYEKPARHPRSPVKLTEWPRNDIDYFVLSRLERAGLKPAPEADRPTLIRRLSLDLTGLPPTPEEVDRFVNDKGGTAYEDLVDRLLKSPAYGERWASMWLDLARYADSAGYANDPPRTIWLYRDWVIRALNDNMPFDEFTRHQLAGDLLDKPTQQQLIATAFHRNTLTNSEGGTNDEEFRNVAVVDRVNTTMQVWMGVTIRCAQCHDHKYDPISQKEYFRVLAFFNNTEDADQANESPTLSVFTEDQEKQRHALRLRIADLKKQLKPDAEELARRLAAWEAKRKPITWTHLPPTKAASGSGATLRVLDDRSVLLKGKRPDKDKYRLELTTELKKLTAIRIETLPDASLPRGASGGADDGSFVLSGIDLQVGPSKGEPRRGRFVRLDLPGKQRILHLAEVQAFGEGKNLALSGKATQSSTGFDGPAKLANDGNTDGDYAKKSVSHTAVSDNPWWEVDLGRMAAIDRVVVWNRTDNNLQSRLEGFVISLLDEKRQTVWTQTYKKAPQLKQEASLSGLAAVSLKNGTATFAQASDDAKKPNRWTAASALDVQDDKTGWSVAPGQNEPQAAAFETAADIDFAEGAVLDLTLSQSFGEGKVLGRFRVSATDAPRPVLLLPVAVEAALAIAGDKRDKQQRETLLNYYRTIDKPPKALLDNIAKLEKQLAGVKATTVPILRELAGAKRRKTKIQIRGNFLVTTDEVNEGTPEALHGFPDDYPKNRLGFARWLTHEDNPLTARVVVNRFWEQLFGVGIVGTSEEFGTQGELPSHPKLLDWLATELTRRKWNTKEFLRLVVTSAAYRQSSSSDEALLARDPDNRLLARGPRFRLSAEMIRDQALAVSGLLNRTMHGPPVRPPRPKMGLRAAFGGSTDWETSPGGDKHRRGVYTSWRRSLPYPSMSTFDAPSRNVCTIRRGRTNTPLQALVTLNDPVYVEAAQALARRMISEGGESIPDRAVRGFRLCLARQPREAEVRRLVDLFEAARAKLAAVPEDARELATVPIGPPPKGVDVVDLAAWTVVGNVLLNLDEVLAKR